MVTQHGDHRASSDLFMFFIDHGSDSPDVSWLIESRQ